MKTVAALVHSPHTAYQILEAFTASGIDPQQVGMAARSTSVSQLAQDTVDELPISAVGGVGLDALLGAAANALVGAGEQVLPGIGAVVVTGPVAAALDVANSRVSVKLSDAAGSGTLAQVLAAWGFAEPLVREYEVRVAQGDILLVVVASNDHAAASSVEILQHHGADLIHFCTLSEYPP